MVEGSDMVELYALCEPGTDVIRYIGKAKCARKRLMTHIRDSRRRNRPVNQWVRAITATGNMPVVIVLKVVPSSIWEAEERALIAEYRAKNVNLLNVADGGATPKSDPIKSAIRIRKVVEYRPKSVMRIYRILEYYISMSRKMFPHKTDHYIAVKEQWRKAVMVARSNGRMSFIEQKAGEFLVERGR